MRNDDGIPGGKFDELRHPYICIPGYPDPETDEARYTRTSPYDSSKTVIHRGGVRETWTPILPDCTHWGSNLPNRTPARVQNQQSAHPTSEVKQKPPKSAARSQTEPRRKLFGRSNLPVPPAAPSHDSTYGTSAPGQLQRPSATFPQQPGSTSRRSSNASTVSMGARSTRSTGSTNSARHLAQQSTSSAQQPAQQSGSSKNSFWKKFGGKGKGKGPGRQ